MIKHSIFLLLFSLIILSCNNYSEQNKDEVIESCCDFIPPPPPPVFGEILTKETFIIDKKEIEIEIEIIADKLTRNLNQEQQNYILFAKNKFTKDSFNFLLPYENIPYWNDLKAEVSPDEKTIFIGFNDGNSFYRLYSLKQGEGINKSSLYFTSLFNSELDYELNKKIIADNIYINYSNRKRNGEKISPRIWIKGIIKYKDEYYKEICIGEILNLSQKIEYSLYQNLKTQKLTNKLL
jgi:hypothetical protein